MPEAIQLKDQALLTPVALTLEDKSPNSNLVVLFHTTTAGIVIQSDGHFPIGHYSSIWIMNLDWKLFHGTITINFS